MSAARFDDIVVGAGQAGPALAARCSNKGLRTAILELGPFGGSGVDLGRVPTSPVAASARARHLARRGTELGVDADGVRVDMARVKARQGGIVGASREGAEAWTRRLKQSEFIAGRARLVEAATLDLGGRWLTAAAQLPERDGGQAALLAHLAVGADATDGAGAVAGAAAAVEAAGLKPRALAAPARFSSPAGAAWRWSS